MPTSKARELRKNPTEAERLLWRHLRYQQINGYKFRRQRPVGPYIVDFVCLENNLIIELDGGQHNENQQSDYDSARTVWLQSQGFKALRFWNNQVLRTLRRLSRQYLEHWSLDKPFEVRVIVAKSYGGI